MRKNKLFACLLAGAMAASLAACGSSSSSANTPASDSAQQTNANQEETKGNEAPAVDASIDFEDGNFGFVQTYMGGGNASELEISVDDFSGSKALKVKNVGGQKEYVGIDVSSLLGAKVEKVATIEMQLGVKYDDNSFSSVEGNIYTWTGTDLKESKYGWSVYLESKNPNTAKAELGEKFVADSKNVIIVSLETDNGAADHGAATLYIDNIVFKDESGKKIDADTSAGFNAPDAFAGGADYSNLSAIVGAVDSGWAGSGDGWGQDGFDMSEEFMAALVPGSVVQIEFKSETGDMWLVMNGAEVGWSRVGQGTASGDPVGTPASYINNSKNIAQVTYEQLAQVCGEDPATWGTTMQCESSGAWEVYSVKVGMAAPVYALHDAVDSGWSGKGDGWGPDGFDMSEEFMAALVPGAVLEIYYKSETDNMWLVMNGAEVGWSRVGQGNYDGNGGDIWASCIGGKCYVTYEQLAAVCGDDPATWGTTMQCESSGAWEVYSVKIGPGQPMKMVSGLVDSGWSGKGDGWGQDGFDMSEEFMAALVPGAVITISYKSETGDMWLVMNGAEVGWSRVGQGNYDGNGGDIYAACDGSTCQVTYEQIAAVCGDDPATWGTTMQCESSGAWEVYSVAIGQGK